MFERKHVALVFLNFFLICFVFETRFRVTEARLELLILRCCNKSGMVIHDCGLSTPEAEAGGSQRIQG